MAVIFLLVELSSHQPCVIVAFLILLEMHPFRWSFQRADFGCSIGLLGICMWLNGLVILTICFFWVVCTYVCT